MSSFKHGLSPKVLYVTVWGEHGNIALFDAGSYDCQVDRLKSAGVLKLSENEDVYVYYTTK